MLGLNLGLAGLHQRRQPRINPEVGGAGPGQPALGLS